MKSICKLLIIATLSALSVISAEGQSGNTMRFVLTTGADDFQLGSSLYFTVNLTNGSRLPETRITNAGMRLNNNSVNSISVNIGQSVDLVAIRSITLRFEGARHTFGGSDNWNLDAIQIALLDRNSAAFNVYDSRNDPGQNGRTMRFTRDLYRATFTRQVAPPPQPPGGTCSATQLTVVPRGGSCGQRINILFPDRPLSAPTSDCGQQYFPQNRTDVWYTFTMPASGRVGIDFNRITTAMMYTGKSCNAIIASGACREDAGGNKGETFINFEAPRSTRVYLRVFGSAGSRRTLCVYEW